MVPCTKCVFSKCCVIFMPIRELSATPSPSAHSGDPLDISLKCVMTIKHL